MSGSSLLQECAKLLAILLANLGLRATELSSPKTVEQYKKYIMADTGKYADQEFEACHAASDADVPASQASAGTSRMTSLTISQIVRFPTREPSLPFCCRSSSA